MPRLLARRPSRAERGSAIADFALVSVVLVPLFFAIVQVALVWHVKTTLTSAAAEGARDAAAYDGSLAEGRLRTEEVIDATFGDGFEDQVSATTSSVQGQPVVEVRVLAHVPVLAFWGPTVLVHATGHAVQEILP